MYSVHPTGYFRPERSSVDFDVGPLRWRRAWRTAQTRKESGQICGLQRCAVTPTLFPPLETKTITCLQLLKFTIS